MAITIPSRHIYDTPQNNKVKNNLIDNIVINAKTAEQKTETDYIVYNGTENNINYSEISANEKTNRSFDYGYTSWTESGGAATINGVKCCYAKTGYVMPSNISDDNNNAVNCFPKKAQFTIQIDKQGDGIYTQKILEDNINVRFTGKVIEVQETGDITARAYYEGAGIVTPFISLENDNITWGNATKTQSTETYSFPQSLNAEQIASCIGNIVHDTGVTKDTLVATANVDVEKYIIGSYSITEQSDKFLITFNVGCGITTLDIRGAYTAGGTFVTGSSSTIRIPSTRIIKTYQPPYSVEITVQGKVIKIDLSDNSINIPSLSGNNPFPVEANELLQTNNLYGSASAIQTLFADTYNHYKNGKETAVVLCDIADYFDGNELIISPEQGTSPCSVPINISYGQIYTPTANNITFSIDQKQSKDIIIYYNFTFPPNGQGSGTAIIKKGNTSVTIDCGHALPTVTSTSKNFVNHMTFQQYDEVIPMIFGADGKDYPMSEDANGNAKVFKVLHTRIFYDGAVWQELTLQEK